MYLQLGRERSASQRYTEAKEAYAAALRLDPLNAEAKEIIEMIEAGGGAPVNVSRAAKPSTATAKAGEGCDLMAERPAGSKKGNMRAPKPC